MSSDLTGGWPAVRLSQIAELSLGKMLDQAKNRGEMRPYLANINVRWGSFDLQDLREMRFEDREFERYCLRSGDIVMCEGGEPGRCALWLDEETGMMIQKALHRIRPMDGIDSHYLYYALAKKGNSGAFAEYLTGGGIKHLPGEQLAKVEVPIPPFDEQRRIAEVLRSVDDAIAASEAATNQFGRVIEQEANAVIGSLFAEESVTKVKVRDIALVKGGKRLPKGSSYEEAPTANPYIRVTDWTDYQIDPSDVRYISDEIAGAIRRYTISSEDLFISIAGSIGLVASVPPGLNGAYLTENAAKIVINHKNAVDPTYLLVALRSELLAEQIRQQKGVGGGVPKLALFRIEELYLPLPEIGIQREIAASYLSLKVARERAAISLKAVTRLKADLADDLLSGRVRVPE